MLRKNNLDFLTVDYPGFGRSQLIKNGMDIKDYGEIIFDVLQQLDVKKAVFVGLSMGGYVALALYRKHPEIFSIRNFSQNVNMNDMCCFNISPTFF